MGGYGSGRWELHRKADTVEECRNLDANRWTREGILKKGVHHIGGWKWSDGQTGEETASIGYEVCTHDGLTPWLRLRYTVTSVKESLDYTIRLQVTWPQFGGLRWWFSCPLVIDGNKCERRVGKLYLPPGGKYFGCRHCYHLTYRSAQEHDKRVDDLRRNPAVIDAMMRQVNTLSPEKVGLLLKALG